MKDPTLKEVAKQVASEGFGEVLPEDYSNSTPVVAGGYMMPDWMAQLLGHIGRKDGNESETT